MPEHREHGINLFKQRCVQKCHSHGEACQPAFNVWWVRASSRVCSRSIKHSVCPVWFRKLLLLNGLFCQHLLIPLRSEQRTFLPLLCWDFPGENRCEITETERIYNHYRPNPTQSPSNCSKAPFSGGLFLEAAVHFAYLHRTGPPTASCFHSSHSSTYYFASA